jgi:hypothetical protein
LFLRRSSVRPDDMHSELEFKRDFVVPIELGRGEDATPAQVAGMVDALSVLHDLMDAYVQRCG